MRFLSIAHGSSYELQTQIIFANKLSLLGNDESQILIEKIEEIQKMNFASQNKINKN